MLLEGAVDFCPRCGNILPYMEQVGDIKCLTCDAEYDGKICNRNVQKYSIHFVKRTKLDADDKKILSTDSADGPVVERRCPRCGNDKMSYATLQLRSVDEGQTVFYTCTVCKFKETENS